MGKAQMLVVLFASVCVGYGVGGLLTVALVAFGG